MPTYEYECSKCGHQLEILQSITEKPLKKCPECQKNNLQRLLGSGAGIIFKGSGFYETDYKKKEPSKKESKSKSTCPSDCPNKSCSASS
ncbi:MAG: zinc ribbon domain-containing protein [Candidatus Omnitrophica bacterium]|nr:zinc ribbon domain-containing protein [Candidatus Omnitrophota bacterium]